MYFECHPEDPKSQKSKLYVVTSITNPCRYQSRYRLYVDFAKMVQDAGGILYPIEAAFGNRPHAITEKLPNHIQLRTYSELWQKENLLNIAISRLPSDWEYVAWIDADIVFSRPDWVKETIHQLQHYMVIQMFSIAQDLTPDNEPLQKHNGFVYSYSNLNEPFNREFDWNEAIESKPLTITDDYHKRFVKRIESWHPGFAWAARREAIDKLGGLIDFAILGAADRHMAHALIGRVKDTFYHDINENYKRALLIWEDRANRYIRRNIGYLPGLILHRWHGKKGNRNYKQRWNILLKHNFDPELDLKKDWQGLHQLTERSIGLRDDLRAYFRMRNEDSIDLDESEIKP